MNTTDALLEQVNRMLDFNYWYSGLILSVLAIFMGYQYFLKEKQIKQIEEQNNAYTNRVVRALFMSQLRSLLIWPSVNSDSFKDIVPIYIDHFEKDIEIKMKMKEVGIIVLEKEIQSLFDIDDHTISLNGFPEISELYNNLDIENTNKDKISHFVVELIALVIKNEKNIDNTQQVIQHIEIQKKNILSFLNYLETIELL